MGAQPNPMNHATPGQTKAPVPQKLNVSDVIHLTARLAKVLAQEVDYLTAMQIKKVGELQQEKLFLTSALEGHRKMLAKYPQLRDTIPSRDQQELRSVIKVFEDILAENHKRLKIAREANHYVVKAITKAVREHATSSVYGAGGVCGALGSEALSVTFNQTA